MGSCILADNRWVYITFSKYFVTVQYVPMLLSDTKFPIKQLRIMPSELCGFVFSVCVERADIIFAIDSSGSINEEKDNWSFVKTFMKNVVRAPALNVARDIVRVGIVVYSNSGSTIVSLSSDGGSQNRQDYINYLTGIIDNLGYVGGTTNIADGIEKSRNDFRDFRRGSANQILILISDGKPNEREVDTEPQAADAKSENIEIITVGVTDQINVEQMTRIASGGKFLQVADFDDLELILEPLLQSACGNQGERAH